MPTVRTPASLAGQIRKHLGPNFDFSLNTCLAVGHVVLSATRRPPGPRGREVRPYRVGLVEAAVAELGGPAARLKSSELYRMAKFARLETDDAKFVAACLQASNQVTWTHVMRLLPVQDSALRLKLLRECIRERLSVRRLRVRIFAEAGYLPPRTGTGADEDEAPDAPAVLARDLRRACDRVIRLAEAWDQGAKPSRSLGSKAWPGADRQTTQAVRILRRAAKTARVRIGAVDDALATEAKREHFTNPTLDR
jgi:hypothetical protein